MIRAMFFDLDDTLCDSAAAYAAGQRAAFTEALASTLGLTERALADAWARTQVEFFALLEDHSQTIADAHEQRFFRMLALAGAPDEALAVRLKEVFGETQLAHLRAFDDVAALGALRERGVFVGVITNGADDAHADSQRSKAAALGLLSEVDGFWASDTTGYRKPDPRAFAPALAAAGYPAERCLYVGDSLVNDIAGANAAGLRSVLLLRGDGQTARDVETRGVEASGPQPWRVVRSLWETLDLLNVG